MEQKKLHKCHPLLPRTSVPYTYDACATLTKNAHNKELHYETSLAEVHTCSPNPETGNGLPKH